jgi:hypothetical protein
MNPDTVVNTLNRIAAKLANSKSPSRDLIVGELNKLILQLGANEEPTLQVVAPEEAEDFAVIVQSNQAHESR